MKIKNYKAWLERELRSLGGCGNNGCVINPPKGMGTNSSCMCGPYYHAKSLHYIARELEDSQQKHKWDKDE